MRPKPPSKTSNEDLFRSRLDAMLDDRHHLDTRKNWGCEAGSVAMAG